MTVGGETGPRQSADGPTVCRLAGEWLQTGQYEQAAAVLGAAQLNSTQAKDPLLVPILSAARRLCLACKQCQEEAEWHRQAQQETERRERELREQIYDDPRSWLVPGKRRILCSSSIRCPVSGSIESASSSSHAGALFTCGIGFGRSVATTPGISPDREHRCRSAVPTIVRAAS